MSKGLVAGGKFLLRKVATPWILFPVMVAQPWGYTENHPTGSTETADVIGCEFCGETKHKPHVLFSRGWVLSLHSSSDLPHQGRSGCPKEFPGS